MSAGTNDPRIRMNVAWSRGQSTRSRAKRRMRREGAGHQVDIGANDASPPGGVLPCIDGGSDFFDDLLRVVDGETMERRRRNH